LAQKANKRYLKFQQCEDRGRKNDEKRKQMILLGKETCVSTLARQLFPKRSVKKKIEEKKRVFRENS